MSNIEKADSLMQEGKKEEAKQLLMDLLQKNPTKKSFYADAVNIYLAGDMFAEAKDIFELYKQKTGKKLTKVDFTLDDIENLENDQIRENKQYGFAKVKIFKHKPFWGRWYFSNYFTLFPVKEIKIDNDKIILKIRFKEYHYRWNNITSASIVKRKAGKYAAVWENYVQQLFILETFDRTFKFDVSPLYPIFKNTNILVKELKKYLNVKEGKTKKEQFLDGLNDLIVNATSWFIGGVGACLIFYFTIQLLGRLLLYF